MNYLVPANNIFDLHVSNLFKLSKLIIKELIESSMKNNRILDSNDLHLQNFFCILEHLMQHGMKPKYISFASSKKNLWTILQNVSSFIPECRGIEDSINEVTAIKTYMGKVRSWLRFAFVQKRLSDYFRILIEKREFMLMDCYGPNAFLHSDEALQLQGLMVGLNIIDCNWCAKDDDLDNRSTLIDITPYLKDVKTPLVDECVKCKNHTNIDAILDQKNYLEELNRNLNLKVFRLQKRLQALECNFDSSEAHRANNSLSNGSAGGDIVRGLGTPSTDGDAVSVGDDCSHLSAIELQLSHEKEKVEKLESELEKTQAQKNEAETALRLLEHDIHEKQDTIVTLRTQLDEIKSLNIRLFNQVREKDALVKSKCDQAETLEQQNSFTSSNITRLEMKLAAAGRRRDELEETIQNLNEQVLMKDSQIIKLQNDQKKLEEKNSSLEATTEEQRRRINLLQTETREMKIKCARVEELVKEHSRLKRSCQDYELSLEQIGAQLKDAKLERERLKEITALWKDAAWARNDEATACTRCDRPFTVTRRKHHCRNCGNIYCAECSNNKMALPSSSKPVRVCDGCNLLLLDRYCAN